MDIPGFCADLERLCGDIATSTAQANNVAAAGSCAAVDGLTAAAELESRARALATLPAVATLPPGLRVALRSLHASLREICAMTAPTARLDADASAIAASWRRTANTAYIAIWLTRRLDQTRDHALHGRASTELAARLQAAAWGSKESLAVGGHPMGAADRGTSARRGIDLPIRLFVRSQWRAARATSISRVGLGIDGIEGLVPGGRVLVALPSGDLVHGDVVWGTGSHTGLIMGDTASRAALRRLVAALGP